MKKILTLMIALTSLSSSAMASVPEELLGAWATDCVGEETTSFRTVVSFSKDGTMGLELQYFGDMNGDTTCSTQPSAIYPRGDVAFEALANAERSRFTLRTWNEELSQLIRFDLSNGEATLKVLEEAKMSFGQWETPTGSDAAPLRLRRL